MFTDRPPVAQAGVESICVAPGAAGEMGLGHFGLLRDSSAAFDGLDHVFLLAAAALVCGPVGREILGKRPGNFGLPRGGRFGYGVAVHGGGSFADFLSVAAMRRLDAMVLRSRWTAEGGRAGRHASLLQGASVEFRDHRDYVKGDSLRHLDWKVYGRSERHYIKRFQEETSLRVHLVLDASASMRFAHGGREDKFTFARRFAAAVAYLTFQQQDACGLVAYDDETRVWLPARGGTRHTRRLLEVLGELAPHGRTDTGKALEGLAEAVPRRGVVILLSDLLDDPEAVLRALAHFRRRGHDVVLIQVMDPAELEFPFRGVSDFIDMETGERLEADGELVRRSYREAVAAAIEEIRGRCGALRVEHRVVTSDRDAVQCVEELLAERERLGA